jgi:cysteinyl-tRNA synthetase
LTFWRSELFFFSSAIAFVDLSNHRLEQAQLAFRLALCDSFDTPKGLQIILDLVSATNVYLARGRAEVNISSVVAVADWVTRMLRMFGLGEGAPTNARGERLIGWGTAAAPGQEGAGDVNFEDRARVEGLS